MSENAVYTDPSRVLPFNLRKGIGKIVNILAKDANDADIDFTGYSATFKVYSYDDLDTVLKSGTVVLSTGNVAITIPDDSANLTAGVYYYQLKLTLPDTTEEVWLNGDYFVGVGKQDASTDTNTITIISGDSANVTLTVNAVLSGLGNIPDVTITNPADNDMLHYNGSVWNNVPLGLRVIARNNTGVTITKGQAVYITGAISQNPTVALAKADAEATHKGILGVAVEDIANNTTGDILTEGTIKDFDTTDFTDGDTLWLSADTAGALTNVEPVTPNHSVRMGICVYSHVSNGILNIRVGDGFEIGELHDVLITSIKQNDILQYDGSKYINKSDINIGDPAGLDFSYGKIVFGDGDTSIQENIDDEISFFIASSQRWKFGSTYLAGASGVNLPTIDLNGNINFTFSVDSNTGFGRTGNDAVQMVTGGIPFLTGDASQNVTIPNGNLNILDKLVVGASSTPTHTINVVNTGSIGNAGTGGQSIQFNSTQGITYYSLASSHKWNGIGGFQTAELYKEGNWDFLPRPLTVSGKTFNTIQDISGQATTTTYDLIYADVTSTGRTSTGEANFINFNDNGANKFKVDLGGLVTLTNKLKFSGGFGIEATGDNLYFTDNAGSGIANITSSGISFNGVVAGLFKRASASSTNPNIVPHSNDTDTGIGGNGLNSLSLITGGIETMNFDASQNVTIPNGQLDVTLGSATAPSISFAGNQTGLYGTAGTVRITISGTGYYLFSGAGITPVGTLNLGTSAALWNRVYTNSIYDGLNAAITMDGVGNVTIPNGNLTVSSDTDATTILGRARIDSRVTDQAFFSHFDQTGSTFYAIKHTALNATYISGNPVVFTSNGTEVFRLSSTTLIMADGRNIQTGSTTGSMFMTGATQKGAFWGATPIVQPAHIADPAGGATIDAEARTAIAAINAVLASTGLTAAV